MAVDDHGLEVLKKAGEEVVPGNQGDYYIKTLALQAFSPPKDTDAVTVTYPSATQEVYAYRSGGISGTILATVTVNYTNGSKDFILNVAVT